MQNLLISFNTVVPMFLMMVVGMVLKRRGLMSDHTQSQMNNLVFRLFIPLQLLYSSYTTDLQEVFNLKLVLFTIIGVLVMWATTMGLVVLFEKNNFKRGALIQGMFRSNFVLLGLPIVISLFGAEKAGVTSIMIAIVVPSFNILSVITLETFRGGKVSAKKMALGIIQNPIVIASIAGIFIMYFSIKFPYFIEAVLSGMAGIASPLSLVVMGASFVFGKMLDNRKQIIAAVAVKLIIIPLVFMPLSILFGFRGVELATLMAVFSCPTAVSSYTMAAQTNSDGHLASGIVVFTTFFSCFTLFSWIFVLKHLGFM